MIQRFLRFADQPIVVPLWMAWLAAIIAGVYAVDKFHDIRWRIAMERCVAQAPKPCKIGEATVIVRKRGQTSDS
jgi:hypothetical protein